MALVLAGKGAHIRGSVAHGRSREPAVGEAAVEDVDPIRSYYSTVTRRLADGTVFYPDQRMTRMEALRSYTISNAYAAKEEALKGSLEPGKLADVVVLSRDILTCSDEEILRTEVDMTIVGGEILHERR